MVNAPGKASLAANILTNFITVFQMRIVAVVSSVRSKYAIVSLLRPDPLGKCAYTSRPIT